ncbi:MAG: Mrp/NBP35 family ATP-binding protein [Candidatus Sumerlaeia bacterium]|nr:Mrp/NBP35 family ATP-binding protein [Candidatus Sumerlaeia bacterium]
MTPPRQELESAIWERLKSVHDPELHRSLVELKMVKRVAVTPEGRADLQIELTTPACPLKGTIRADIEKALEDLGLAGVEIDFTADVTKRSGIGPKQEIPGVRNIITVGAGKGGVGKSTVATNLAIALAQQGARVGLLDSDIYGPNIPMMMGITGRPVVSDNKILPLEGHGVKVMSIGMLLEEDTPVIWRGPMLHTAVGQFLFDVAWGELDYLIVDLPPGTGDVQLSMSQRVPVTGAVAVCTPSSVAMQDVKKAIMMFRQLQIPLLGLVENMRGFCCPNCQTTTDIFSSGSAEEMAQRYEVPYLGWVPLHADVRIGGDTGRPIQAAATDGPIAEVFRRIAQNLAGQVSIENFKSIQHELVQIKT